MSRTLLALLVPEAEPVVGDLRDRLDPAAKLGLGAHITLVYPFLDSDAITPAAIARLREVALAHAAPAFELATVRTFPSTVWLEPSPSSAIVSLATALERAFPERPRHGREFPDFVPHVSVARNMRRDRDAVIATLEERLHSGRPVACLPRHVHVMQREPGAWRTRVAVPLGG